MLYTTAIKARELGCLIWLLPFILSFSLYALMLSLYSTIFGVMDVGTESTCKVNKRIIN
jgi:hypothetical protein